MDDFCKLCGNIMYVKDDAEKKTIIYYCKNCHFTQTPAEGKKSFCIHTSVQDEAMKHAMFLNPNIKHDPTLPRVVIPCTNSACTKPSGVDDEVIYMKYDPTNMKYIYFCTFCDHFWQMGNGSSL